MRRNEIRTLASRLPEKMSGPIFVALAIFYLAFHVVSGEHGVYALLRNERELEILKAELADVQAKNKAMETRVKHMSDSSLDLDMLDEQSRRLLDDAGPNEVVIPVKK